MARLGQWGIKLKEQTVSEWYWHGYLLDLQPGRMIEPFFYELKHFANLG